MRSVITFTDKLAMETWPPGHPRVAFPEVTVRYARAAENWGRTATDGRLPDPWRRGASHAGWRHGWWSHD